MLDAAKKAINKMANGPSLVKSSGYVAPQKFKKGTLDPGVVLFLVGFCGRLKFW